MFNLVKIIDMVEQPPIPIPGQSSAPVPPKQRLHPVKRFFRKVLIFLGLFIVLSLLIMYVVFNWRYGSSSKAGTIVSIHNRGYIFKTWEGELNTGGAAANGSATVINDIWHFSVANDSLGHLLEDNSGQKVILFYTERVKNLPWQGETKYFIDSLRVIR